MRRLAEIGAEIRAARVQRGFPHVKQLAEAVGIEARRLSDLELGRRTVPRPVLQRIAEALALPDLAAPEYRGGPRRTRGPEKAFLQVARVSRPEYNPPADRPTEVRRNEAWRREPELVERLEARHREREDWPRVNAFLKSISCASYLEYLFPSWELAGDAQPLRISPHEIGYAHKALVDPGTLQAVGDRLWPALGIQRAGVTAVGFFNAPVRVRRFWVLDILLYLKRLRRSALWTMVEIDGDGHDDEWNDRKQREVGLYTVRLSAGEVVRGRAWECILRRLP